MNSGADISANPSYALYSPPLRNISPKVENVGKGFCCFEIKVAYNVDVVRG